MSTMSNKITGKEYRYPKYSVPISSIIFQDISVRMLGRKKKLESYLMIFMNFFKQRL